MNGKWSILLKQSHSGSQGQEAPTASLACRSRSFSVLKRCCSALSALRRSWGRVTNEGVQGPPPTHHPSPEEVKSRGIQVGEWPHLGTFLTVSASGLYWTGICYHPIPKGWHGLREGFGDPHLPPLTMRSFSAMSSSSSFLRCSKCTSMSVCSSSRSFSMRFRWMSCRTEGGSPVMPRSGPSQQEMIGLTIY